MGLTPATGAAITGLTCAEVTGTIYTVDLAGPACRIANPGLLTTAKANLTTAYNDAAGRTPTAVNTELAGQTLVAGVYRAASGTFGMTGTLVLDGENNADAVFIFQMGSTLTVGGALPGNVSMIRGAQACNVFWQVGSAATLNTGSNFVGTIMAHDDISLTDAVTVNGRLPAGEQAGVPYGAVTLIHDTIIKPSTCDVQSELDARAAAARADDARAAAVAAEAARAAEAAAAEAAAAAAATAKAEADKAAAAAAAQAAAVAAEAAAKAKAAAAAKIAAQKKAAAKSTSKQRVHALPPPPLRVHRLEIGMSVPARSALTLAATEPVVNPTQELASLLQPHVARARPASGAAPRGLVAARRPITEARTVLPVLGRNKDAAGVRWLRVMLPGRPNGRTGWIRKNATVELASVWHLVVDTSRRRVGVYRRGRLVRTFAAVVGKASTPTPRGRFFVEESIKLPAGAAGAPFALALSARSNVLQEFEGGPGQIALHGLANVGGVPGTAVSHGCVRLTGDAMRWLVARLGPGDPVTIRG